MGEDDGLDTQRDKKTSIKPKTHIADDEIEKTQKLQIVRGKNTKSEIAQRRGERKVILTQRKRERERESNGGKSQTRVMGFGGDWLRLGF